MRILITGGTGFIGSNLCKKLLGEENEIICMDNNSTGRVENIKGIINNAKLTYIEHDIECEIKIEGNIDQIYHLACPASPPAYQKYPLKTLNTNYIGTKNVLELAYEKNARVLFTSTSEVYGDPNESPQKETYWGNVNTIGIRSCYDEGKRVAETLMIEYNRCKKVDIRIARIFNTYGPNMDKKDGRVVSNIINQMLENKDITIYGEGKQTRSFCYVEDTMKGLCKLMNTENVIGPVNIGNDNEMTIIELCDDLFKLIPNTKSNKKYQELPSDDPKKRKPDLTRARELLKWEPQINLEIGLKSTIEYFKNT
jgi:UDP-glucuronate decarboxylase